MHTMKTTTHHVCRHPLLSGVACLLLGSLTWPISAVAVEPAELSLDAQVVARSTVSSGDPARLAAVFAKARRGEPLVVAAIGGSITAGGAATAHRESRYVEQVAAWFRERFPGVDVRAINAGIGATNSFYGAARLQPDVLAHAPDVVIVEFAVNDFDNREFAESYEGLIRQVLVARPHAAVLGLFFMHGKGENAQNWQQILGRHYGLPMVSFRDAMWPEFSAGRIAWSDYYADVVHPNDAGHLTAAAFLRGLLDKQLDAPRATDSTGPADVPPPLISDRYERCRLSRAADLVPTRQSGWTLVDGRTWECGPSGGEFETAITGEVVLMGRKIPKEAEQAVFFSIDGADPQPIPADPHNRPLTSGLASSVHTLKLIVKPYGTSTHSDSLSPVRMYDIGAAGVPMDKESHAGDAIPTEALPLIFNGKDLAGWAVPNEPSYWTVVDGVLVGASDERKKGSMLYTEKSYGDVVVEGEVRFTGEIDSGIMVRRPEIQAQIGVSRSLKRDMTCSFYTGTYPEEARAPRAAELLEPGQWNRIRLEAKGDTFTVWLNGEQVSQYTNAKYKDAGPIGLQVHGGLVMKVEFRDLRALGL
jgi:lysophospholipase L1-like esterase